MSAGRHVQTPGRRSAAVARDGRDAGFYEARIDRALCVRCGGKPTRGRPPDPRAGLRPFPLQFVVVDPPVAFPAPAQECGCLAIDEHGRREAFWFRIEADTD